MWCCIVAADGKVLRMNCCHKIHNVQGLPSIDDTASSGVNTFGQLAFNSGEFAVTCDASNTNVACNMAFSHMNDYY